MPAWYGKNDQHVLTAIASGDLVADPATGHIDYCGKPAGRARSDGYIIVAIRRMVGKKWLDVPAHRIVWMHSHTPIPAGMVINHRNKRRWDNRLANLELTSQPSNTRHAKLLPYAAVSDHDDDNCVSLEWFEQALQLAGREDVTIEQIRDLVPASERMPEYYAGGARNWRNQIGRRGETRRAS